jgi:hypothetical protein
MPALTSRQQARRAAVKAFMSELDRIIPPDQTVPLKGAKFVDWEDRFERLVRTVAPTVLEQRVALQDGAAVDSAGRLRRSYNRHSRLSRHRQPASPHCHH